jgi:hypothetical protein
MSIGTALKVATVATLLAAHYTNLIRTTTTTRHDQ